MKTITITGCLYDIKLKRDGGSRIQIDCGADSIQGIKELAGILAQGDTNLAFAIVPFSERYGEQVLDSGESIQASDPLEQDS